MLYSTTQNRSVDIALDASKPYASPFRDVRVYAILDGPAGEPLKLAAFWAGDDRWVIRFASDSIGRHRFRTVCSDETDEGLHGREGDIEVTAYTGSNTLFRHGAPRKSANGKYLEHADGTPFFWLADTWWMALTKRLPWPDRYGELLHDRVEKGFTVVQIVAGLYPDMHPFDERGANEAGFPWDEPFHTINPEYFNSADDKIFALAEAGIVPCIVGSWGFFMHCAGKEALLRHWDHLIARYASLPVVWCIAGEALMPFYTHPAAGDAALMKMYQEETRRDWTEMTRYVRSADPYARLTTIHPTDYGRDMVDDDSLLDLEMLQTGHSGFFSGAHTMKMISQAVNREPRLPVINSEVSYEGICGSSHHDVQRFYFWTCVLSGACGHTYGANGIWQVNSAEAPYGVSPHGASWGDATWEEAYRFHGSKHVGLGRKLLAKYRWWEFEPHPEWVENHAGSQEVMAWYAAGIPQEVRIVFLPFSGGCCWKPTVVKHFEPGVAYRAYWFDPLTGREFDQGPVEPDENGTWRAGKVNAFQDWILVLEAGPGEIG